MRTVFVLLVVCLFWSCESESQLEKEIDAIDIDVEVERFDKLYAKTTPEAFPNLKQRYPFLFSERYSDSLWITRLQDTLQQQLLGEVGTVFNDFTTEENEIESLFKHLKYYNKAFKTPRVITVTNDVDYRNKVIITDTIVLIALDNYLGGDHEFYTNIQKYIKLNFVRDQIVVDLADAYAKKDIFSSNRNSLLTEMINAGKALYFKDLMIPFKSDAEKIGYTEQHLEWAKANESNIWSYFVERELLFDTDPKLALRFIYPAPFTKFGLELDNESPGRLGEYIGWQIVRAYMSRNNISWQQLITKDAEEIFNNSGFKPRK